MDAPEEEPEADRATYEVDGDTIVPDASQQLEPDESPTSEWHRDED